MKLSLFFRRMACLLAAVVLLSCGEDAYEEFSRKYRVYFMCSTLVFPQEYNEIAGLGVSQFVTLRAKGAQIVMMRPSGATVTDNLSANNVGYSFGNGGLIVGRSTYADGDYCCFDLSCPNCDGHNSGVSRFAINQTTGHATCPTCGNVYGLNNNGALVHRADSSANSTTRPLYKYRVVRSNNSIVLSN
ncbi:MAG: hypothetical protein IKR18_02825 [Bacteroidaceae bacterium]|nr:hypothetical protein [Bacteroidaceae bacterium]